MEISMWATSNHVFVYELYSCLTMLSDLMMNKLTSWGSTN